MTRRTLIVLLIVAGGLITAVARKAYVPQGWEENDDAKKLKFSHTYHMKDVGVACEDCHKAAKTSKLSSDHYFKHCIPSVPGVNSSASRVTASP